MLWISGGALAIVEMRVGNSERVIIFVKADGLKDGRTWILKAEILM